LEIDMSVLRNTSACAALALAAPLTFAQPLSLEDALRAGEAQSPRLAAQRHMITSASEQVGRAGELPDPKLRLGIENLPVTGPDRFQYDRDFMTMRQIGWAQEFPNGAKREARNLRAERMRDVEGANLSAQRAALYRDIAIAWIDVHFAERMRTALERLARQFQLHTDTVSAAVARGRQSAAEGLMVRHAFEQANDRLIEQERMMAKARIALATWIGDEAGRPLGAAPEMERFAHPREHLVDRLGEHPQLRVFERREGLARAEVDVARSEKKPDWMLEVGYGRRRPAFDDMFTVMVSIDLPLRAERRQDRDIASRVAELEQVRSMREDARRMHEAEVRGWLADFDTAQRRIERFERVLLPLARDRSAAAGAPPRGGRGGGGPAPAAARAITETAVAEVQALAERAKAWANLNYLYPIESSR
jgi:outer membrane protein, heavy metal efflux system